MDFNWIDLLLAALVLAGILVGWRRGFLLDALDLAGWLASLWAGIRLYQPLAAWLTAHAPPDHVRLIETWGPLLAFLLVFIPGLILLRTLCGKLLAALPPRVQQHAVNRAMGVLPGAVNGLIHAVIAAVLLAALPLPAAIQAQLSKSVWNDRLAAYGAQVESQLRPVFEGLAQETMKLRTVRTPSGETVKLGFTRQQSRPRADLEAQMLQLLNKERAQAKLPALTMDAELTEVARRHSADMLARGYFSHHSPERKDAFDRLRAAGVAFLVAGENLAYAPTVGIAHSGLMKSPGHRANILRPQFRKVGIGIMDAGPRGIMVTQNFSN